MKLVMLSLALAGCALTSRSAPMQIRYYAIDTPRADARTRLSAPCELRVRIGSIEPDSHLRERIARRVSPSELALYDARRWTEVPDVYVRRALEHALFERRPFQHALAGAAPTIDIEVTAFEEVESPRRAGRVELRYHVRDDRDVLATDEVVVERPASGTDFAGVVDAIGDALDVAVNRVADTVGRVGCR
jgi:cholesterol transport system auxiliary component